MLQNEKSGCSFDGASAFYLISNVKRSFDQRCLPLRTTAEVHHYDTTEDHEGGKNLLPTEGVHAEADADGGGDDGLHVGVHADQGGTNALLPYRDEEIGNEGGADDEVSKLREEGARKGGIVDRNYLVAGKGKRHKGGEKEYPLHERGHRITGNERFEKP